MNELPPGEGPGKESEGTPLGGTLPPPSGYWPAPPWQTWPPPVARLVTPPPRRPLTWDHPGLLVALVGVSFILAVVSGILVFQFRWRPGLLLAELVAFLLPAVGYMLLMRGDWRGVFRVSPSTAVVVVLAVPVAAGVWFAAAKSLEAVLPVLFPEETIRRMQEGLRTIAGCTTGGDWLWTILGVVVAPAVVEEMFFRGVVQRGLQRRWRRWPALIVTALVFAGIHMQPLSFPVLFVLGLEFGWLYQRTGSLWPAVTAHGVNNLLAVLAVNFASPEEAGGAEVDWQVVALVVGLVVAGSLLVIALATRPRARGADPAEARPVE